MTAGPPFESYPVTSCEINSASNTIASKAAEIESVAAEVQTAHRPALLGSRGTLRPLMALSSAPIVARSQQLTQAGVFAAGALELFGNAVQKYDLGITRLNERWADAEANNFGVVPMLLPSGATVEDFQESQAAFERAVNAAREQLRRELQAEQRKLEEALDNAADRTAGMLGRGPNAADIKAIDAGGGFVPLVTSLPFSMARGFLFGAAEAYAKKMAENASKIVHYTTLIRNRQVRMPVAVADDAARARAGTAAKVLKAVGNALGWATGITAQHDKDLKEHPDLDFAERVGRDLTQAATTVIPAGKAVKALSGVPVLGRVVAGTGAGATIDQLNNSVVDAGGDVFREQNEWERFNSLTQPSPLSLICDERTAIDCLEDIVPESWK